jgi:tetratricopeptide (TPR) repeat protein
MHVPSAAKKELKLFQQSFQSNNILDSAKHLENAIEIYPQSALVHHYLGVCYFRLHQYDKAITQFQSASILDEHLIQADVSLSVVFFLQARYPEAEAAARHALEVNGTIPEAQYLLGAVLAVQGRDATETTELLRESSARYPVAHLILAELFLRRNSKDEAVAELRQYLKGLGLPQEDQNKAACLVEKLTQSSGSSPSFIDSQSSWCQLPPQIAK